MSVPPVQPREAFESLAEGPRSRGTGKGLDRRPQGGNNTGPGIKFVEEKAKG